MHISNLKKQIAGEGIKMKIIPVKYLKDVRDSINIIKNSVELGEVQKWIINKAYVTDSSWVDFAPKSIVIVARRNEIHNVSFTYKGITKENIMPVVSQFFVKRVEHIFKKNGFQIAYNPWFPAKRLAACSGLTQYGRNNITYIEEWGSFFQLAIYLSDIPYDETYKWTEAINMKVCHWCNKCINVCPTKAIRSNQFIIDIERCVPQYTEVGKEPLPDFIPENAYESIIECYICQKTCPINKGRLKESVEEVHFTEEETSCLLQGMKKEELPEAIYEKIDRLNMHWFYESIPRNLRTLFKCCC